MRIISISIVIVAALLLLGGCVTDSYQYEITSPTTDYIKPANSIMILGTDTDAMAWRMRPYSIELGDTINIGQVITIKRVK